MGYKYYEKRFQGQMILGKDGLKVKTGLHTVRLLSALDFSIMYCESERRE